MRNKNTKQHPEHHSRFFFLLLALCLDTFKMHHWYAQTNTLDVGLLKPIIHKSLQLSSCGNPTKSRLKPYPISHGHGKAGRVLGTTVWLLRFPQKNDQRGGGGGTSLGNNSYMNPCPCYYLPDAHLVMFPHPCRPNNGCNKTALVTQNL